MGGNCDLGISDFKSLCENLPKFFESQFAGCVRKGVPRRLAKVTRECEKLEKIIIKFEESAQTLNQERNQARVPKKVWLLKKMKLTSHHYLQFCLRENIQQ